MTPYFKRILLMTILSLPGLHCPAMDLVPINENFQQKNHEILWEFLDHQGMLMAKKRSTDSGMEDLDFCDEPSPKNVRTPTFLVETVYNAQSESETELEKEQKTITFEKRQKEISVKIDNYLKDNSIKEHYTKDDSPWRKWHSDFGNTMNSLIANINKRETITGNGWTPLHLAVHLGDLALVEFFLERRATFEKDETGKYAHELYDTTVFKDSSPADSVMECRGIVVDAFIKKMVTPDPERRWQISLESSYVKHLWSCPSVFKNLKIRGVIPDDELYRLIMLPDTVDCLRWWFMNQNCRASPRSTSIVFLMVYDYPYGHCLGTTTWHPGIVPDNHKVDDFEGKAIGKALSHNINMEKVCLEHQEIGDLGAIEIAKALMVNKTLKTLYLDHNQIGDAGAYTIAKALAENTTLWEIHLDHNRFGDAAKEVLRELQIEGKRKIIV